MNQKIRVKMLENHRFSPDGITPVNAKAGDVIAVDHNSVSSLIVTKKAEMTPGGREDYEAIYGAKNTPVAGESNDTPEPSPTPTDDNATRAQSLGGVVWEKTAHPAIVSHYNNAAKKPPYIARNDLSAAIDDPATFDALPAALQNGAWIVLDATSIYLLPNKTALAEFQK